MVIIPAVLTVQEHHLAQPMKITADPVIMTALMTVYKTVQEPGVAAL